MIEPVRGKRLIQVACVGLSALAAVTCVETNTSTCPDGSICAANLACVVVESRGSQRSFCVTADEINACESGQASCEVNGASGTCFGGACFPVTCGDGLVDVTEICDDGNLLDGDDCSALCASTEICGNGVVDLVRGEQCDDARTTLTGDGCSSTCLGEYRVWRDVTPSPPFTRIGYGLVADPEEGLLLFGGALAVENIRLAAGSSTPLTVDDTWRWTGATWIPVRTATTPPRRLRAAIAYDSARERVVMFGGTTDGGSASRLADTWEWDGVDWLERTPPTSPSARADASFACGPSGCVLSGGTGPFTGNPTMATYRTDSWLWDGMTWRQLTGTSPGPRGRAAHAFDRERGRHVLFGGEGGGSATVHFADTWELLDGTETWTLTATVGPPLPTHISPATAAYDEVAQRIVLITGNQTWFYDGTWTYAGAAADMMSVDDSIQRINPKVAFDPRRGSATMLAMSAGGAPLDAYALTRTQFPTWNKTEDVRPGHKSGVNVIATYDPVRGRSIVFDSSGTFEWDGVAYRRTADNTTGPQLHYGLAMAHDARCGITLAFGGATNGFVPPTDRTWIYTAGAWTEHTTGPKPPARMNHAMVYDEAHDAIVMFGGRNTTTAFDELWLWTGPDCVNRAWQQVSRGSAWPAARSSSALAYDAARARIVMFGGVGTQQTRFDDTWVLDGTTWTLMTTAAPSARVEHALTYDPRRQSVILFGGRSTAGNENDTWEWDGVTWRELATVLSPQARGNHALARDVTGGVVAFGGENVFGFTLPEVARLRSELSLEPLERCLVDSADDDADGLTGCADPDCWGRCAPLCPYGTSCTGPACGDSVCSDLEDYLLCPVDCPRL